MNRQRTAGTVSAEDYIRRVKKYPTWQVLRACRGLSVKEEDMDEKPWRVERKVRRGGFPKTEWVYVTQFHLAFLAKLAIAYSDDRRASDLTPDDLFELLGHASLLDEPFLHENESPFSAWSFLIRTAWWQFPSQSGIRYLLPRYLTMFRHVNDRLPERKFDVPSAWEELTGISLEDSMVLGFMLWAHSRSQMFFELKDLQNPKLGKLYEVATTDRLERIAGLGGSTYREFRSLQNEYEIDDWLYIQTEFNALLRKPLILAKRGWIAPIPRLVIERFTSGLFFDLMEAHREENRNDFLLYYGRLFEEYVGLLLADGWGQSKVTHEPAYDKGAKRGPDWIVFDEDKALLFECKGSRLKLPTKTQASEEDVRGDLRRIFVEPLKRYPKKIADLKSGAAEIDVSHVQTYYPCVVTADKIYLEPVYRQFIDEELRREGIEPYEYYLLDVDSIELLSTWAAATSVCDLLDMWTRRRKEAPPVDFDIWRNEKGRELGLQFDCPRLKRTSDEFFGAHATISGAQRSSHP